MFQRRAVALPIPSLTQRCDHFLGMRPTRGIDAYHPPQELDRKPRDTALFRAGASHASGGRDEGCDALRSLSMRATVELESKHREREDVKGVGRQGEIHRIRPCFDLGRRPIEDFRVCLAPIALHHCAAVAARGFGVSNVRRHSDHVAQVDDVQICRHAVPKEVRAPKVPVDQPKRGQVYKCLCRLFRHSELLLGVDQLCWATFLAEAQRKVQCLPHDILHRDVGLLGQRHLKHQLIPPEVRGLVTAELLVDIQASAAPVAGVVLQIAREEI
mmetsp:Transcript_23961/g.66606  ORF Transcript_23961/g.66606 Transcript_23961/m.66606 type:complete len:272 (-) Transcript_23961:148-963(-)